MAWDIVEPSGNEEVLLAQGKKLGFTEIIFLYKSAKDVPKQALKILPHQCMLLSEQAQGKHIILSQASRAAIEHPKINYVFRAEEGAKPDHTHYRNSGMNQVLAKLIADKKKTYCFDISLIRNNKKADICLGRMMQNAKILRKYKARTAMITLAKTPEEMLSPQDLLALADMLGVIGLVKTFG